MFVKNRYSRHALIAILLLFAPFACLKRAKDVSDFSTARPESQGFSATRLDRMQEEMQRYVDEHKLAGVTTLVARQGKIVHFKTYAMQDIEARRSMQNNTIFRLASLTKPITSVAMMMLVEHHRMKLDDPISKYIPPFAKTEVFVAEGKTEPLQRPITVKDVLMHTSGISAPGFASPGLNKIYAEAGLGKAENLADFVERLAALPLNHQPGAGWSYGYSTDVAARIVEAVSGEPFGQFVEQKILQPLQMRDTGFQIPKDKHARLAVVYSAQEDGSLKRREARLPEYPRGASGIVSTVTDYLRFAQMLMNGGELNGARLLNPETVALMTQNHLPEHLIPIGVMDFKFTKNGFGLGVSVVVEKRANAKAEKNHPGFWWHRGAPPIGAYGWIGAYMTYFWVDPANEIIGMVFTQSADGMKNLFMQEFHELVYAAFENEQPQS